MGIDHDRPPAPVSSGDLLIPDWSDFELLDSGDRRKLERFGSVRVIRPEPKAWWKPSLPGGEWSSAHAVFDEETGQWHRGRPGPGNWHLRYRGLTLEARLTDHSKHLGVFPEQEPHWRFIASRCGPGGASNVLNLFGYTGVATLVAAAAGAAVTHCDASKPAIAWGRANQEASGLAEAPVRWILDDAVKFLQREIRRGRRYDAILLDPPSFGRGPRKEVWKVEEGIVQLLELCARCLSDEARFLVLTLYNLEASPLMLDNLLRQAVGGRKGRVERGELVLPGSRGGAWLPLSLFARWEAGHG